MIKQLNYLKGLVGDEHEEPLLWFALAETQWKVGRLVPEVKDKALEWIKKNGGLEPWLEEGGKGTGWHKTLEKLKQKLESPMPAEKKIKKPERIDMHGDTGTVHLEPSPCPWTFATPPKYPYI